MQRALNILTMSIAAFLIVTCTFCIKKGSNDAPETSLTTDPTVGTSVRPKNMDRNQFESAIQHHHPPTLTRRHRHRTYTSSSAKQDANTVTKRQPETSPKPSATDPASRSLHFFLARKTSESTVSDCSTAFRRASP